MNDAPSHSGGATHSIGELCVGGDWACANGDLETLGYIAERLATYVPRYLHPKLTLVTDLCRRDPDRAVAAWMLVKEQSRRDGLRPS